MKASREIDASRWIQWDGLTDNQSEMEDVMRKGFSTLTPELGP